ncbi:hypothetical protein ONO39_27590, partial [Salmonella enterica subsp. enterica serovar Anatum]|nr:hypothetical protein [Salmonella enterica subsp. enterica serovar Anatum]
VAPSTNPTETIINNSISMLAAGNSVYFSPHPGAKKVSLKLISGMGSQFAVILAAVLLVVSRELMRDFNEYSMLMLGGLMVLMM